jgi:23S rRNA (uracil1939-C5)-methyltransferase
MRTRIRKRSNLPKKNFEDWLRYGSTGAFFGVRGNTKQVEEKMKKGDIIEGKIEQVSFPNKGKLVADGQQVIVKNTIPGQKVRAQINKKKAGRVEARLLEVLDKSPQEKQDAICSSFPRCGGCLYRTMQYEDQRRMKEEQLFNLFEDALRENEAGGGRAVADVFEGVLPAPSENRYRNKMEYAFGDACKGGPLTLGLHKKNSTYDIMATEDCALVHEDFNRIVRCVRAYFGERNISHFHRVTHDGYLRHLLVRRAERTGEILVDLVTASAGKQRTSEPAGIDPTKKQESDLLSGFREALEQLQTEGRIVGILHTVNDSLADVIRNDRTEILSGRDYFKEELLGLSFRITPFSFFQTNTRGAEGLYRTAIEFLGDVKGKTVFDLYTGTGTIAQVMAPVAKEVIGVEIVEEAVEAAIENAKSNHLDNCRFIAGDVLAVLDALPGKPDAIVLDPPRDGVHPKALPKILAYGVEHIVYISCKPTSLVRDLAAFREAGYRIERMKGVDLFVGTAHIETVCLLSNLKTKQHIEVEINLDKMDLTSAESKATYAEIKDYVLEHTGLKVSNLYIAQVKQKHKIIERVNYNMPKNEDSRQPKCPEEKEKAIEDALRYFQMI